ncbi:hypothetical protein BTVI_137016 [Pitangus sulphuratus]|nr:hypothetical protein BTVI_137016 [Pitangus sulphuratus]
MKEEKVSEPVQKEAWRIFSAEDFGPRDEITAAKLGYSLRTRESLHVLYQVEAKSERLLCLHVIGKEEHTQSHDHSCSVQNIREVQSGLPRNQCHILLRGSRRDCSFWDMPLGNDVFTNTLNRAKEYSVAMNCVDLAWLA